jgi:hypothetical protein
MICVVTSQATSRNGGRVLEMHIGVLPVSWDEQGDEWEFHLANALSGSGFLGGQSSAMGSGDVILAPPPMTGMQCSLRVRRDPGGIACIVFGHEGPGYEGDVARWREAAEAAVAKLGHRNQDFSWRAIVGPSPAGPAWQSPGPLADAVAIGPVELAPGGVQMRELAGFAHGRIDSPWPERRTWPVVASGIVRGYSEDYVEHRAQSQVHRVCALLSLISGIWWTLRSSLSVWLTGAPERRPVAVPQSVGPWESTRYAGQPLPADFNVYDGDKGLSIPPWAGQAWKLMDAEDESDKRAVHGCYEAMALEGDHPSVAFLMYVATIEGIGARLIDLRRCKSCGSHIGATERFRTALATVLPPDEARKLGNIAYRDYRSKTGHEARLFGGEDTFGYSGFSKFTFDEADVFFYGYLMPIRNACRQIIGKILREGPTP